jgi:hypothetical protein
LKNLIKTRSGCNFCPFGYYGADRKRQYTQTAQEVKIDLLFYFETSQNLTGIDYEKYGFVESTGCNSPILQNEFFGKDATKDLLF